MRKQDFWNTPSSAAWLLWVGRREIENRLVCVIRLNAFIDCLEGVLAFQSTFSLNFRCTSFFRRF